MRLALKILNDVLLFLFTQLWDENLPDYRYTVPRLQEEFVLDSGVQVDFTQRVEVSAQANYYSLKTLTAKQWH